MGTADLPVLLQLADIVHPAYPEDAAVFAERLRLYPDGCLVLEAAGTGVGYVVSHPAIVAEPPPLNSLLGELPVRPTTFYIHDIALLPQARGGGAAGEVIGLLLAHAVGRGLPNMSLTAVNESAPFWLRQGFRIVADGLITRRLRSYDDAAQFMVRDIVAPARKGA